MGKSWTEKQIGDHLDMKCPKCGIENGSRSVCLKCGNFLNNKNVQRETDPEIKKQMQRTRRRLVLKSCTSSFLLMIVAFVGISALMFAIFYFLFRDMEWPTDAELSSEMASIQESEAATESVPAQTTVTIAD